MEGKDYIKDLFSEKLGNYEASVNPELWAKVASQIGVTATTAVGTGMSVLTKILIGLGISTAAVTTAVILMNTSSKTETPALASQVEQTQSTTEESSTNQPNTTTLVGADSVDDLNETDVPLSEYMREIDRLPNTTKPPARTTPHDEILVLPINSTAGIIAHKFTNPTIVAGDIELFADPDYVRPDLSESTPSASYSIAEYYNVFSPNGDGKNDVFFLPIEGVAKFSIVIMAADGRVVFKSNETNFRWDGRDMSSNPVPDGTYVYILTGYDSDGNPVPEYRTLTIGR